MSRAVVCPECGSHIPPIAFGRPRATCSEKCRIERQRRQSREAGRDKAHAKRFGRPPQVRQ